MKKISLIVYGIFGSVALLAGTAALLFPATLEPDGSVDLIHIFREQGAALVFVGLTRVGDPMAIANSSNSAQVDARGQFFADGLLPGTYEVTASYAPDRQSPWRRASQQVVVTNGAVVNVTLTVDPKAAPGRP